MALSPREILQHMEVPSRGKDHPWPNAKGIYILGSLEPVRISLFSQQVRALNLVYALVCEERIKRDSPVAIIGAGPAGLAAARAASHFGAKCYVLEKAKRPMNTFCPEGEGNDRRYVHPSMENWPFPGSETDIASRLPFPRWTAGTPKHVASEIMRDLMSAPNADLVDLHVDVSASIAFQVGRWAIRFSSQKWDWDRAAPGENCQDELRDIETLILAVGFGTDAVAGKGSGYWTNDTALWTEMCGKTGNILVSGNGDGAIIEALCAAVASRTAHQDLTRVVLEVVSRELRDELISVERRILTHGWTADDLKQAYFAMEQKFGTGSGPLKKLDQQLMELRDSNSRVTLLTAAENPYNPRAFAINRFLLRRFICNGFIKHRTGLVMNPIHPSFDGNKGPAVVRSVWPDPAGETSITREHEETFDWRIHRHGTKKSLEIDYPRLYEICKLVLQPKNELDQTRVPAWPDNFFTGRKLTSRLAAKDFRPAPLGKTVSVKHEHEFAVFRSICCVDKFVPFT